MNEVRFPEGMRLERLTRSHPRRRFRSGEEAVDDWIATKALQHQSKHLSMTKALVDAAGSLVGYCTLATAQIDFAELPPEQSKHLPRRMLPVAVLAWLGVDSTHRGHGLGARLLAQSLRDCWNAGKTFPIIGVVLDCISDASKAFYQRWDFRELPGKPYRLFFGISQLEMMMQSE